MSDQLTFLSEAPPAKTSASPDSVQDWLVTGGLSPLNSFDWLSAYAPAGWRGRMSPEFCRTTADGHLEPSSGRWGNSGMGGPTESLTLNTSEWTGTRGQCPSDGAVCSLSDILETQPVPERHFSTPKACRGVLLRAEKRGKRLPEPLRQALESVAETVSSTPD